MKLEAGMYVRTYDGYISKYDNSKHNCSSKYYGFESTIRDVRWEIYDDDCFLWKSELNTIVKASNNIIDLIEVGDYVNGHKIDEVKVGALCSYVSYECMGEEYVIYEKDIKSIVTKEQFSQIEYKVD